MKKIIVYTHSDCLLKDNGPNHPEKKERLQIILKSIQDISSIDIEIKKESFAAPHCTITLSLKGGQNPKS